MNLRFQNIDDRWRQIILEEENPNKGTRIPIFTIMQIERMTFFLHCIFTWSLTVDRISILSAKGRGLITSSPFPIYSCSMILKRFVESMLSISYKLQRSNRTSLISNLQTPTKRSSFTDPSFCISTPFRITAQIRKFVSILASFARRAIFGTYIRIRPSHGHARNYATASLRKSGLRIEVVQQVEGNGYILMTQKDSECLIIGLEWFEA